MAAEHSPDLSIVVPVYNESSVLGEFHKRLTAVLANLDHSSEIIFVNDGSSDDSLRVMLAIRDNHPGIAIIDLSRNFGKEVAMSAGLDHAAGKAVVIIDADLQDPPEMIPKLVEKWEEGNDVVSARRTIRRGETWLKRKSAHLFYRLMEKIGTVPIPRDTGDFRLLSRRAVDALSQLNEKHRFMKGLFSWVGFEQASVEYERDPRASGRSKWSYWGLWNFALEGITSFTVSPLRISTYFGLLVAFSAFVYGAFILIRTFFFGTDLPGYPSIMVVILFMGGVQLIAIGVIGEYLGRIFNETKNRPLYLTRKVFPSRPEK